MYYLLHIKLVLEIEYFKEYLDEIENVDKKKFAWTPPPLGMIYYEIK